VPSFKFSKNEQPKKSRMSDMNKSAWLVAVLMSPIIILAACSPAAPATPTIEPNAIYTQAAATVVYQLTRAAALVPSPTEPAVPTATEALPTEAPTAPAFPTLAGPSSPAQATLAVPAGTNQNGIPTLDLSVQTYQTPTISSSGQSTVDKALWQYNVPADNSTFTPNQQFPMAFGVKNAGPFTWTKGYSFKWFGGTQMSGVTRANFNKEVKPGEKIEFDFSFEAPNKPGKYITRWAVYNSNGNQIGQEIYFQFNVAN
jgi:hypothetical protein